MEPSPRRLFRVGNMPTSRIESFSDNIFAFGITLLVLSIQVPTVQGDNVSAALTQSLHDMVPKLLVYVFSFFLMCLWWMAHHHLFHIIKRADRGLVWLNNLFLLWMTFVPFPAAFMGSYPHEPIAVVCYGVVSMLAGVSFCLMRYYAFYVAKLVDEGIDPRLLKAAMVRSMVNPLIHLIAIFLVFVDTRISVALYITLMGLFFVPSKLEQDDTKAM
jgi:uncharacterized membrane protein